MRSVQKVNTTVRVGFVVFNSADVPVTGLVDGNFDKLLTKDGANSVVAVTVAEVGGGRYTATFTPNATGHWQVWITHATHNVRGWIEDFDVTSAGSDLDDLLDLADGVETGYTVRQTLRLIAAVLCGKASGGPGNSVFRSMDDSADRVASEADSSGNRTTVTLTP